MLSILLLVVLLPRLMESIKPKQVEMVMNKLMLSLTEVEDAGLLIVSTYIMQIRRQLSFIWNLNLNISLTTDDDQDVHQILRQNRLAFLAFE